MYPGSVLCMHEIRIHMYVIHRTGSPRCELLLSFTDSECVQQFYLLSRLPTVMASSGASGGPAPTAFLAVTRKLYCMFFFRPVTSIWRVSLSVVPT